jgi:hypothetical protein
LLSSEKLLEGYESLHDQGQLQSFSNPDLMRIIATIIVVVAGIPTTLDTRGATA